MLTNARPGRDDEFNEWYTGRHSPDALTLPGFVDARRYRIVTPIDAPFRYLAVYTLDDVDLAERSLAEAQRHRDEIGDPEDALLHVSPAIQRPSAGWWYETIGDHLHRP